MHIYLVFKMADIPAITEEQLQARFQKQLEEIKKLPVSVRAKWFEARKQELKSSILKLQLRVEDLRKIEINDLECSIEVKKESLRMLEEAESAVIEIGLSSIQSIEYKKNT